MPSKEYHREKSKEHYDKDPEKAKHRSHVQRARNRKIIHEAKSSGCIICPEREICALDLHHIDPEIKDFHLGVMMPMSTKRVIAEIAKCVVLCANCHRKVHAGILTLS